MGLARQVRAKAVIQFLFLSFSMNTQKNRFSIKNLILSEFRWEFTSAQLSFINADVNEFDLFHVNSKRRPRHRKNLTISPNIVYLHVLLLRSLYFETFPIMVMQSILFFVVILFIVLKNKLVLQTHFAMGFPITYVLFSSTEPLTNSKGEMLKHMSKKILYQCVLK